MRDARRSPTVLQTVPPPTELYNEVTTKTLDPAEIRALVKPNGAHRRLYTEPAIFELEMERIFERAWIGGFPRSQTPS